MIIYINSKLEEIPQNVDTVGKLLDYLKVSRNGTGVGINNRLVKAKDWDKTFLRNEDRVMIISAAYGGWQFSRNWYYTAALRYFSF